MAYSSAALDHFHSPRNSGTLENPDATGTAGKPGRGNYMVLQVKVSDGLVVDARFQTYGCPGAIACGSATTELVKGLHMDDARSVSEREVLQALGGLPRAKEHCAGLAVAALRDALAKLAPGEGVP